MPPLKTVLLYSARVAVTGVVVIAALVGGKALWTHYQVDPWTRDGRVRADVVQVAPDVSGLVTRVEAANDQMVKAGQLRPIAVTTSRRVAGWENVPALSEVVPGFDYTGWIGIVAPAGTPAAAIDRFNRDLDEVLKQKDMAARLLAIGATSSGAGTVQEMATFLHTEDLRWAKLTRQIGVQPK